jgi:hypothetical protein
MASADAKFPPTPHNVGRALWELDRAAGRLWRPGQRLVFARKPGLSQDHLRNAVVEKAISEGLAVPAGVHSRQERSTVWEPIPVCFDPDDEDEQEYYVTPEELQGGRWVIQRRTTHLKCYEISGFRFMCVTEMSRTGKQPEELNLSEWLSGARRGLVRMTLQEAQATLEAYLEHGVQAAE